MNTYVFVGPTISAGEARNWLDAIYLPPVAQGDIISLLRRHPKIIGIIDGYFERVPSVWHKEILLALSQGVHVVGGASMGALRAAELDSYGMVGVGEIFEWYRDGKIEADDEVAVHHAPLQYGYQLSSEPLVNIRKTLELACENAIISPSTLAVLITIGRQTYYYQRSYEGILGRGIEAGLPENEMSGLREYVAEHKTDLKKLDAIRVLEYVAGLQKTAQPVSACFELSHTTFLEELLDRDLIVGEVDGIQVTLDMLANHAKLECDDFLGLRDRAIFNMLILGYARQLEISITDAERQQGVHDFLQAMRLDTPEEAADWVARNHLTEQEFAQLVGEWVLIRKMKDLYLKPDNCVLIRQLRLEGKYEKMVRAAADKEEAVSRTHRPQDDGVSEDELYAYYAGQKHLNLASKSIQAHAIELGFDTRSNLLLELRKYLLYHRGMS